MPIAIDGMSGDVGPVACVGGAVRALLADDSLALLLTGDPQILQREVDAQIRALTDARDASRLRSRVEIVPAADVVPMDESPRTAIRRRKQSSMRIAIDLVASGRADGCVSAGNTGALTAMSHFVLKSVPGVDRAPILSRIPSRTGHTCMLDLGANTHATPEQLAQFARMGTIVARDVYGVSEPRVGLLNIGDEDIKGHAIVQAAHALIAASGVRYVGFVEGNDIFTGDVDVVVTDGFTGNVALKTMEGVASLIGERLRAEFTRDTASRLRGLAARPVLERVASGLDPRRFNGACMVGLTGVVVKSHGGADAVAVARAVGVAATAVRSGLVRHVARAFERGI